jgi:hypothetical protein
MPSFPIQQVLKMATSVKEAGGNLDEYVLVLGDKPTELYLIREKDFKQGD